MTPIGYAKPTGVPHPRGHHNCHRKPERIRTSTILFQAWIDFKVSRGRLHRLNSTGTSSGLFPFSAIMARRDKHGPNRAAPRPQVFSTSRQILRPQPLAGLFHPADTRRVLVFRVLPQVGREPSPALHAPSLLPVLHGILPYHTGTCRLPHRHGPIRTENGPTRPLTPLPGLVSVLDFSQPWSFAPDMERFASLPVSPGRDSAPLLTFILFRVSHPPTPDRGPPLSEFTLSLRVFLWSGWMFRLGIC
jgi:hypothetical protein